MEGKWVKWCGELAQKSVLSKCSNWYNGNGNAVVTYAGTWWDYIASLMSDTNSVLHVTGAKQNIFTTPFVPKHAKLPDSITPRSML